jgi:hypothetical protein
MHANLQSGWHTYITNPVMLSTQTLGPYHFSITFSQLEEKAYISLWMKM